MYTSADTLPLYVSIPPMKMVVNLLWVLLSVLGAVALAQVVGVLNPHEKVNGLWLVVAAACIYVLAYRFYGRWLARHVVELNNQRVTPAVRMNDGVNFHPTNKAVLFGHHFAAIAGAGPLLGPVLAAQFGFLPGFLWLVIGAVLAGAVQDFIILVASMRRNGRSLPPRRTPRTRGTGRRHPRPILAQGCPAHDRRYRSRAPARDHGDRHPVDEAS